MSQKIDSHHHLWQLSQPFNYSWLDAPALAPIRSDFLPDDLQPHLTTLGIDRTIVVQTQHNLKENQWALALAEKNEFIAGVVGWVDLASSECESQITQIRDHPKFVGVRHVLQDEPDDNFIVRDDVIRGLKVLEKWNMPFDLLFDVKHLHHASSLAQILPDLPMVIDHLAKPRIKDRSIADWLPQFKAAARFPNVYCKLSGMVTEADWEHWTVEDLKPYVHHAIDLFGPERLMFGSDWPVCELAATYFEVFEAVNQAINPLSDSERAQILGGTATRFYSLK